MSGHVCKERQGSEESCRSLLLSCLLLPCSAIPAVGRDRSAAPAAEFVQALQIADQQCFLLRVRPFFDLNLTLTGLLHAVERFGVNQRDRTPTGSEFRAPASVVHLYATARVGGRTHIVHAVGTTENVYKALTHRTLVGPAVSFDSPSLARSLGVAQDTRCRYSRQAGGLPRVSPDGFAIWTHRVEAVGIEPTSGCQGPETSTRIVGLLIVGRRGSARQDPPQPIRDWFSPTSHPAD